jgi:uncharacterized peroxidase-related enzyme
MLKTAPRLSRVARAQATPAVGEIYDRYMRTRGNVPNMFRTMAHRPEIFETMIAHFEAILQTGTVPLRLKELVIVRTSQLNRCEYCLGSHTQIALNLGWSREQLENLTHYADRRDFTAAEKAALRLAEQMTVDANHIPEEDFDALREHFDEGEIVELMAAIGLFNYFNRFNNALQMEPTKPGEGGCAAPAAKTAAAHA